MLGVSLDIALRMAGREERRLSAQCLDLDLSICCMSFTAQCVTTHHLISSSSQTNRRVLLPALLCRWRGRESGPSEPRLVASGSAGRGAWGVTANRYGVSFEVKKMFWN